MTKTEKYWIVTKQGWKDEYPYMIRDQGGMIVTFHRPHHYTGQDERFKRETQEIWDIANKILGCLNGDPVKKAKARAYSKEYRQRPYVKEKERQRAKENYEKKKTLVDGVKRLLNR